MNPGHLAYLVGPDVFDPHARTVFDALQRTCEHHGVVGLEPVDGGLSQDAPCTPATAERIYTGNVGLLRRADGIIANLQSFRGAEMDSGSAFEIGYGLALGKPVMGYLDGTEAPYAERVQALGGCSRDTAGRLLDAQHRPVEDFGLVLPVLVMHAVSFTTSAVEAVRRFAPACDARATQRPASSSDLETGHAGTVLLTQDRVAALANAADLNVAHDQAQALLNAVRAADHVVIEADSFRGFEPSGSLALLAGYAVGLNKPVDLVLDDHRDHGLRVLDSVGAESRDGQLYCRSHGWLVESFGLPVNLMLGCSARALLTPDQAWGHGGVTSTTRSSQPPMVHRR